MACLHFVQSIKRLGATLKWRREVRPETVVCTACAREPQSHYMHCEWIMYRMHAALPDSFCACASPGTSLLRALLVNSLYLHPWLQWCAMTS
jgi:hypothetical protein